MIEHPTVQDFYENCEVGDVAPALRFVDYHNVVCAAPVEGFGCTRADGHTGRHVAEGDRVLAIGPSLSDLSRRLISVADAAMSQEPPPAWDSMVRDTVEAVLRELSKERPHGGAHTLCLTGYDLLARADEIRDIGESS